MTQIRKLVTALTIGAALFAPVAAVAETTVQNQNSSTGAHAQSGNAEAHNEAHVSQGPKASSAGGGPAQSQQIGNNHSEVRQSSRARSGDSVAGSQVTGVGGGNATVQNSNSSVGAFAATGNASASNFAFVEQGPQANSLFGPASASQLGSNSSLVAQDTAAESGDAVSGSQVTGII